MAGVECYGGACVKCGKGLHQKWESMGGFQFDACMWCGFAVGEVNQESITPKKIWKAIFEHFHVKNLEEFRELCKANGDKEYMTKEESDFYPSVFNYTSKK